MFILMFNVFCFIISSTSHIIEHNFKKYEFFIFVTLIKHEIYSTTYYWLPFVKYNRLGFY